MLDEFCYISPEGLKKLAQVYNPNDPAKNIKWTTDYTLELPIRLAKQGAASEIPITLVQLWQQRLQQYGKKPALSVKRNGKWQSWTYQQYYDDVIKFANALLYLGVNEYASVNILGFNAPEWLIAYYGSIFSFNLPVGIYTTNQAEACFYISDHSDCELVVVENEEQLKKYLAIWDRLPKLKAIVLYNDPNALKIVPQNRKEQVYQWKDLMDMGTKYRAKNEENSLENRMKKQKPGNCCTLVYTSGTTGPPKAVMLSHDNFVYGSQNIVKGKDLGDKIVSFLPLSHVVGQLIDIVISMNLGMHVYFAQPDALQGSLVQTLQEVRPTLFFTVPRIWEKMEEKMKVIMNQNGFPKKQITNWAMSVGKQGTFAEHHKQSPPLCFGLAKRLVYEKVKKNLGLDEVKQFIYGAAPMQPSVREFFLNLNIFLVNGYGMSETTGGHTLSYPEDFDAYDGQFFKSTGKPIDGTNIKIFNPDQEGNGEICFRGRNIFMGYFKNEQSTRESIDGDSYLHSGDLGRLDAKGNLQITGRLKELIVTAGGENVAPVIIENEVLKALPIVSNCMVVGDYRKFLACILTLKHSVDKQGKIIDKLSDEVIEILNSIGSKAQTVKEAIKCQIVKEYIQKGIDNANKNSISKAAYIRKWALVEGDFSQDGGELTPTLKLKRKPTADKYKDVIELMYIEPKL